MWTTHPDFLQFVRDFLTGSFSSSALENLSIRIRNIKQHFKWWNWNVFGDVNLRHNQLLSKMDALERDLQVDWNEDKWKELTEARKAYMDSSLQQEKFLKQKSKVKWLAEGDRNSKFFHAMVKMNRRKNFFLSLMENPRFGNNWDTIAQEGVKFFQTLLSADHCALDPALLEVIPSLVYEEDNRILIEIPSAAEVKRTVFSIPEDNAPGPDGLTGCFFTFCWDVVGQDVVEAVQEFFMYSKLPRALKSTFIALIPKPRDFHEFRPISLCNVSYKIISKLLATRLGTILAKLISPLQGAFVTDRNITENIALTQELIQDIDGGMHGGNLIIKLDMEKAYDRLSWDFLFAVLKKFGFSDFWLGLIKQCVTGNSFSLLVNGSSTEFIRSSWGLRQGDPISPALFILAEEVLSRGITELHSRGQATAFQVLRRCPPVTHLLFADDTVIFTNGSKNSLKNLMHFLKAYETGSGQKISEGKSNFYASQKTPSHRLQIIQRYTGFSRGTLPFTYLGCKIDKGRN